MLYFEAPDTYFGWFKNKVFLAGGITGCPDWQQELTKSLSDTDLVLFNPRRQDFPINDPSAAEAQIKWEFNHLRIADAIAFWFPSQTLCPIALYELGTWSNSPKPLFIGVHSDYQRLKDVVYQTRLIRPDVRVVQSLKDLAKQIIDWAATSDQQDTNAILNTTQSPSP